MAKREHRDATNHFCDSSRLTSSNSRYFFVLFLQCPGRAYISLGIHQCFDQASPRNGVSFERAANRDLEHPYSRHGERSAVTVREGNGIFGGGNVVNEAALPAGRMLVVCDTFLSSSADKRRYVPSPNRLTNGVMSCHPAQGTQQPDPTSPRPTSRYRTVLDKTTQLALYTVNMQLKLNFQGYSQVTNHFC